ncbi:MAG: PocR ligand-binding domain-containing protein [Kiritimatiellae bacterium]|nr:PocR ligand-binding domain-containing protein [Kiritimatiellia bacterium]
MKPSIEFIFQPDVQRILDHFCAVFGIRIAFFSPGGEEVRVGRQQPLCRFCRLLRAHLGTERQCLALDRKKREDAARCGDLVAYECHAGMTEAIMPVVAGDRLTGYVMIGQFRSGRSTRLSATLSRRWRAKRRTGELATAFLDVPYVTPQKLEHVLGMFRFLVKLITSEQMIRIKDRHMLQPVLAFMQEHVDERFSLADAARLCGRSASTLSHLFRKTYGRSFKRVQIELRVEHAEHLLRTRPELSVREVARRVGYEDALYFSRLFRKYRGGPPRACRGGD